MKLNAITTGKRARKVQVDNNLLQISIQVEKDDGTSPMVAILNIFNDEKNNQYLLTFIPLEIQEFEKNKDEKSMVMENKTRRWCVSKNGEVKTKGKKQKCECPSVDCPRHPVEFKD